MTNGHFQTQGHSPDDAIVVVENVHRHIEEGIPPMRAAVIGAREIAMPIIAKTITLAAVYAPIGFMGGLTGALFTKFAYTLAGAVLISGFITLTLSPVMSGMLLNKKAAALRLRPILMTTAAMVLGVMPLVLAEDAGAVSRYNIGLVISVGLSIDALFTLFVVPVMYTLIAKEYNHEWEMDRLAVTQ